VQRALETVGLSERVPPDEVLTKCQENLERFETLIESFKKDAKALSDAMNSVASTSNAFTSGMNRFFRKAPGPQQALANALIASQDKMDGLIQSQYGEKLSKEVIRPLDIWHETCRILKERIKTTNNMRSDAFHLKSKLDSQRNKGKVPAREDEIQLEAQESSVKEQRKKIEAEVNELVETRFSRMNVILGKFMEIQASYFAEMAKQCESFVSLAAQTNKPPSKPATPAAESKVATPTAEEPAKPAQAEPPRQRSSPSNATPAPSSPISSGSAQAPQQPQQQQQQQPPKEDLGMSNLSAFLAGTVQSSPASSNRDTSSSPTPNQQTSGSNMFDIFASTSPSPASAVSSSAAQSSVAGIDIFGFSSAKDKPSSPSPSPTNPPASAAANDLSSIFGSSSAKPTSSGSAAKPSNPSADLDGFLFGGAPAQSARPTTDIVTKPSSDLGGMDILLGSAKPSTGSSYPGSSRYADPDTVDDDVSAPARPAPAPAAPKIDIMDVNALLAAAKSPKGASSANPSPSPQPSPETPEPEHFADPEEEKMAIMQAKVRLESKINQWKTGPGGELKSLYQLLGSLHTVLWPGAPKLNFNLADLLDRSGIRKAYRKAVLVVHPDRVTTGTVEMKATADLVFDVLTESMKQYEAANVNQPG